MSFEVYTPRRGRGNGITRASKTASVRLSKASLVLNKWAREQLETESVELAFDAETNTIRVGPNGNLPLRKTKVFAKGFFKAFDINASGTFPVEFIDGALFAKIS